MQEEDDTQEGIQFAIDTLSKLRAELCIAVAGAVRVSLTILEQLESGELPRFRWRGGHALFLWLRRPQKFRMYLLHECLDPTAVYDLRPEERHTRVGC